MRKSFLTPQKITLDAAIISRAKKFADAVTRTVDYQDSNQSNKLKIRDDHFISKLGEEAVTKLMTARGNTIHGPDYVVYAGSQKNWNSDLLINGLEVAVKTQKKSAASKYGLSWTFQYSAVRKDPILKNPEAWVCFVECDDGDENFCCTVFPPRKMKSLAAILKEPKLAHLKNKKKVVYAADLISK